MEGMGGKMEMEGIRFCGLFNEEWELSKDIIEMEEGYVQEK